MTVRKTSRPHAEAVIEMLKADPDFANEYLAVALEESDQPGGQQALLAALRHTLRTWTTPMPMPGGAWSPRAAQR